MKKGFIFKSIRVFVIVTIAIVIAAMLVKMRPKAERIIRTETGLLVEVVPVRSENVLMVIEAYGTVKSRETLKLVAEVRGKIVDINPSFQEGSFVKTGTVLIEIDPRTYQLEVARRKVEVKQTKAGLKHLQQEVLNLEASINIARSDATLTRAEFFRLKKLSVKKVVAQTTLDKTEQRYLSSLERLQGLENQLALTASSRDQLEAQLELGKVLLRQAELDLERTRIITPFNGWVLEKRIEKGQYVNTGEDLGRIYKSGRYDIEVQVPVKDLKWLPSLMSQDSIPAVDIIFNTMNTSLKWKGRVARIKAQMDEKTRTLPVVVEVDERLDTNGNQRPFHIRPGMFVTIRIKGKEIKQGFVLPRHMVYPGDVVYLVQNNRLTIRPVGIIRRFNNSIFIDKGLKDGELVIKTHLSGATDGMKVRLK
ncbi:efflux RND transporter periplasmic adaptor subunit [Thermodesulfobacteriota bacterium]